MIILARHGQTEWNKIDRLQGWKNSPLTELGKLQAKKVSDVIGRLVKTSNISLYSSPLGRAQETAKIISASLEEDVELILEPLLKEYSYGSWAGLTTTEVKEQKRDEWNSRTEDKWNYVVPEGESYSMIHERANVWLKSLPKNQVVVAVSHQMIGRTIRGAYLGLDSQSTMALTQENNEIIVLKDGAETKLVA